ncbi:MAG TPA: YggS family pyridoxal phosphate-dependent enzyme [Stellaceae bacterium]|nr:YggS family pyridoxal phosphate-dependent enzyme [Stellaceae bacterium]
MLEATAIAANLVALRRKIAAAAAAARRDPRAVELVAVSKTQPAAAVEAALAAGQRLFGENRVQEAQAKYPPLKARYPDLRLHLIGPLQTNKVKEAVALFDAIETVDRPRLAEALAKEMARQQRRLPCFVEINAGREPQKAGIPPEDADEFIALCRTRWQLDLRGLMCIPPEGQDPAPYFAEVAAIAARNDLTALSMGMSADFEIAIASGASLVRLGTAIFGRRQERPGA